MDFKKFLYILLFIKQSVLIAQNTLFTGAISLKSTFGTKDNYQIVKNELPNIYLEKLSTAGNIQYSGVNIGFNLYVNRPRFSFGFYYSQLNSMNGYYFYSIKNQYNNDQYSFRLTTKTHRNSFGILFKQTLSKKLTYEVGLGCSYSLLKETGTNYRNNSFIFFTDSTDYSINKKMGVSISFKLIYPIKVKEKTLFCLFTGYEQGFITIDRAYYNLFNLQNKQINIISNSRGSQFSIGISKDFNFYKNEKKN